MTSCKKALAQADRALETIRQASSNGTPDFFFVHLYWVHNDLRMTIDRRCNGDRHGAVNALLPFLAEITEAIGSGWIYVGSDEGMGSDDKRVFRGVWTDREDLSTFWPEEIEDYPHGVARILEAELTP